MKQLLILILFFQIYYSHSQQEKTRLILFENEFSRLKNKNKKDSIFILLNNFENLKDIKILEKQSYFLHKSLYLKLNGKYELAILTLEKSLNFRDNSEKSLSIYNQTLYQLSDNSFTIQDFDKAFLYAKEALIDYNLNKENESQFIDLHSIIGYYYFKQLDYKKSIFELQIAVNAAEKFSPCKACEVKNKQAKIYSRLNQFKKAEETIFEAIKIADSCNELVNKINTLKSYRDILIENKKNIKADIIYKEIENYTLQLNFNNENSKIDSLEVAYKNKLRNQENESLKILNLEKESVLKQQKWAIFGMVIGLGLLTFLLFNIYNLSRKRKQYNKDLNRLNILNQKIFSVISHDFKEPITTLKMMLSRNNEIIQDNSPLKIYINEINNQLEQSDEMLDNLLGWAKTELGSDSENKNKINLKNIIEIACKELFYKANEKKIVINNLIDEDITTDFNASVLNIVLRNIINNAIKFSFENGIIDVSFHENCISIKDYGKGIDPKKLEKLFTQNVNPGLGTQYESGFGLGLYLCKELINKNKGSISAINNQDKGCTFTIILPN